MDKRVFKNKGVCRNQEADQQCDLETAREIFPGSCNQDGCREEEADLEVSEELTPCDKKRGDQDTTSCDR